MGHLRYLTHPQLRMDPDILVPHWGLSDLGRARIEAFKTGSILASTRTIVSSGETKALETAAIVASHIGIPLHVREDAHENDRSATGYLPPPEFERVADQFFANPDQSIRGWEKARDAQIRIVKVVTEMLKLHRSGDVLFVGHGGVGTLLLCHFANRPIKRLSDQPPGGGNFFSYGLLKREVAHGWQATESAVNNN